MALQRRRGDPRRCARARAMPATQIDAARRHRPRSEVRRPRQVRSRRAPRRCSTSSATSTATSDGWRDLPDGKPLVLQDGHVADARSSGSTTSCGSEDMTAIGMRDRIRQRRSGRTCSRWRATASCRCGSSATSARPPRATASWVCSTAATPDSSNLSRFKQPEFDRLYDAVAQVCPTARSARSCSAKCRRSSPRTRRGSSTRTATRTSSCYPWVIGYKLQRVPAAPMAVSRHRSQDAAQAGRCKRCACAACCSYCCARRSWRRAAASAGRSGQGAARRVPVAETGFDPQAASRSVLEPRQPRDLRYRCTRYDYLARPYKLVPNTAVALPEISAGRPHVDDQDQAGHLLQRRPGVQGREARADRRRLHLLVEARARPEGALAQSAVYSTASFEGADAAVAKARETGKFDYDAPIEGLAGARSLHAANQAQVAVTTNCSSNLTTSRDRRPSPRGDRSLRRLRAGGRWQNPVGTGPYRLKEWRRGQKIVLEANPGFRDVPFPTASDPGGPRNRAQG